MIKPTVHMNGTSKRMLLEGYSDARQAVRHAQVMMGKIEFNARDYYVQGPEAWAQAVEEMKGRYLALEQVANDLLEIMEHINES